MSNPTKPKRSLITREAIYSLFLNTARDHKKDNTS